jgi:hypothetical protein
MLSFLGRSRSKAFAKCWLTLTFRYLIQYRKLGVALAGVSGQEFYPIYILAPQSLLLLSPPHISVSHENIGLLAVTAGCCSAFFWTLFPGAARDRTELRKGLGTSLYILASYYSSIKATVDLKLQVTNSRQLLSTLDQRLAEIRRCLYIKQISIVERLNEHNSFSNWELNLGGEFPAKTYNDITHVVQKYTSLS